MLKIRKPPKYFFLLSCNNFKESYRYIEFTTKGKINRIIILIR